MSERFDFAVQIAKEAGDLTLQYFDCPDLVVERKSDGTPVTAADKGAEELLRKRIAEAFPQDAILGEEFSDKEGTSGYRWILDPIDGTKSFIHGVPLYSTLIGIEQNKTPIIGVIWLPALDKGVWAEKGSGAWQKHPKCENLLPAKVSQINSLSEALFLTSEVKTFDQVGRRDVYNIMEQKCYLTRTWGDAYAYYLVATGRADLMIDSEMSPWDAGPLLTILEEAGGHFTDWQGHSTIYGYEGIATNNALFQSVLEVTKQYPKMK